MGLNMENEDLQFMRETLPFWDELNDAQQKSLKDSVTKKTFVRGESLHSGDEDCLGLFVLKSGRIRVFFLSETGKEITLYRLFERDICIFSASCIIRNINFEVFVTAETHTQALLIPTLVFDRLSNSSIAASAYANQLMASRFSDVMWVMEQVLFMSFDKRLAIFLLEQANMEGKDRIQLTQEAIANHIGSAREVVTRMLKYFQEEGIVELFRGGVKITNRKKLLALTDTDQDS